MKLEKFAILRSEGKVFATDVYTNNGFAVRNLSNFSFNPPINYKIEVDEFDLNRIPEIANESEVIAVAPVMPMKLIRPMETNQITNDDIESITWGVKSIGADISPFSGNGIKVAVLDTGIDRNHEAFQGIEIIERDFTGDGNGDRDGHGTHCAGTIFGRDVNGIRIGVAKGVTKALVGKVIGQQGGSTEDILSAINWASDLGANVISMSLGIDFPGYVERLVGRGIPTALATSRGLEAYRANVLLFEKVAALTKSKGLLGTTTILIAAAGNENRRSEYPDFKIFVSPPAVSDGFISVAALQQMQNGLSAASFSNSGANIAAPGVNIISAKLSGGLVQSSGTSMAAPHVAGAAALWAEKLKNSGQINPNLLTAKLLASGTETGLVPGTELRDVGSGIVKAPTV